jgi:thioredoxin-like negative regulator of GroEL
MATKTERSGETPSSLHHPAGDEWTARLSRLQKTLAVCPADISTRSDLATLLEQLDQPEEALFNWKAILSRDPNSLKAREGAARCLQRMGRSFQSGR